MHEILKLVESFLADARGQNGKSPVKHLGFISCANLVHIRHVSFYDPCMILVLAGKKQIFSAKESLTADVGSLLTVPAPASFDLRNEPDQRVRQYRALIIPFQREHLERLRKTHDIQHVGQRDQAEVLKFEADAGLTASIKHYLQSPPASRLLDHRLMEILLILVQQDARLLSYVLTGESWSQRVRAILSTDLARDWDLAKLCQCLTTSESTLRRHLRRENSGFRELLYDLRLNAALMQLLQTSLPVYQIADACGYQSVPRFTSNFRKRFGLPPSALRTSMDGKEQKLAVNGHVVSN
ncbi:MAG: helix-turn-helix transcriptional regulator [Gammaproteobacteria bacterium]|nr:helix-turn-helix transcriptional regulator [Gammaproteobacteria bacterium]